MNAIQNRNMMEKERKSFKGEIALLTTAVIWGSGFLMVDKALDYGFSPGFINMMRFSMGALILLIVINKYYQNYQSRNQNRLYCRFLVFFGILSTNGGVAIYRHFQ